MKIALLGCALLPLSWAYGAVTVSTPTVSVAADCLQYQTSGVTLSSGACGKQAPKVKPAHSKGQAKSASKAKKAYLPASATPKHAWQAQH